MTSLLTGRRTAWLVALVPLLLAGALIALLGEAERDPGPTDTLPAGADSTLGTELAAELPERDASVAVVLWSVEEGRLPLAEIRAQADQQLADGVRVVPSRDGTAAIAVVPVVAGTATENADEVEELRSTVTADVPDGVSAQVTGPAAVEADLAAVFEGADLRLLLATATVVAVLLVITYRSPVLWLVPLTVVAVADRLAAVLATQTLAAFGMAWDESTVGILSVLVFGAGTDYALLLISRYRDELRSHASRFDAMAVAVRRTVEPVLASATTVVLGLLTLLLSLIPTTRGLGLACAVGIVVAATFALVVLPAGLVVFGRWIFWPRVPHEGEPALVDTRSLWRRVGDRVAQHPTAFVTGTLALLAVMSLGLFRIETGLDQADQFLDEPEAITASKRLAESFPAGAADPTRVLTRADGRSVLSTVEDTRGVQSARITQRGNGITQVDAVLDAAPGTSASEQAVVDLRTALAPYDDTHVTGSEATSMDERDAAARDRKVILPLILALVLGALVLLLRSLLAPVLLVATVLATFSASLGVSWWLFTGPLGFDALDVGVPLLAFLFLVALGVDYNIFLVTRAREEAVDHGSREGMLRALTATGGVITSAGVLLAAVFAVLGVLPLVVLAQLGAVICIGVLLDTLVVRTVLVPAMALRLGDRFWWPSRQPEGARGRPLVTSDY
ncbi:MMPL family transporter [Nocardioides guangzhouensis]|uniref:MMPL family transporter n=1 Tax=Nocardioides guangzhouensis TaxID=2497878 RepID=A0A4Q4Z281_9ACTN|nr:MMPL family transporter [Nocardioides guangzhouensis]RYP80991.1 MMPL family transporter [Nocardioides guangzhouensis]